jgi:hypothetical protein
VSWRAQLDPALWPSYLSSGIRISARRSRGHRRFDGDAEAICRAVVDACWTGEYLAASAGHFRQLWIRDLGFASEALVALGHRDRVRTSLAWALDAWAKRGHVTTTIFPGRRPRDVWTLGVDSLPMLLWAIRAADADELIVRHGAWLRWDVARYGRAVLDPATGLVRDDRHFSTHRDTVRTRSNAYSNAMLVLLDTLLRETGWLDSPVPAGAVGRFVDAFWRGDRFVDRVDTGEVTGDATVVPFTFRLVPDDLGLGACLATARAAGLADPLPLRYAAHRRPETEDPLQRRLVPDYQGTAIWSSLGAWYLGLLRRVEPEAAMDVAAAYRSRIEADGTVWEVFDGTGRSPDGGLAADPPLDRPPLDRPPADRPPASSLRPYRGRGGLFVADEGMLWAANLAVALAG